MGYCEELVHRRVYTTFLYDSILNWVKTIVDADQTYGPVGSGIGQTCKRCCALVGIGAYCYLLLVVIKRLIAISHHCDPEPDSEKLKCLHPFYINNYDSNDNKLALLKGEAQ